MTILVAGQSLPPYSLLERVQAVVVVVKALCSDINHQAMLY